jgi:hypothetical protein
LSDAALHWIETNQRYLTAALAALGADLERLESKDRENRERAASVAAQELAEARSAMPAPPAVETIADTFGLSTFERALLLLCAGVELRSDLAAIVARLASGDSRPNFGLALAALPDPHWSALAQGAPLRRWRLIELERGPRLAASPLRIDETILHYLVGVPTRDERLVGLVDSVPMPGRLAPSHEHAAERVAAVLRRVGAHGAPPAIELYGPDAGAKRSVAAVACGALGLTVDRLAAADVPSTPAELEGLARLWEREASLTGRALLVDCEDLELSDTARETAVDRLIDGVAGVVLIASRARRRPARRALVGFEIKKPVSAERRHLWQAALGERAAELDGSLDQLVAQFRFGVDDLEAVSAEALGHDGGGRHESGLPDLLWRVCVRRARPRLDALAQRIEPLAGWDDLILPELQRRTLRDIALHVRGQLTVYETWGFAARVSRGLGVSALFAGVSGTGKTMAAEVLANELGLDLYRIDLASVVSKYIGETEKNLRQVFDAAEDGGAILLFDEADALFGKRSEVKDSHDRYANIEISYLLQRMEAYRGLAILTTNRKSALDGAFLRRLRFVVEFPFPDAAERAAIWRGIFPPETPTEELDVEKLARLNVAGGNIRNISLAAAFQASDEAGPVRMEHLLHATRAEYRKLEKPLSEAEIRGWV